MLFTKRHQSRSLSLNSKIVRHEDYMEYVKIRDLLQLAREDIEHSRRRLMEDWDQKKIHMLADFQEKIQHTYTEKILAATLLILKYLASQEKKIVEVVVQGLQDTIARLDIESIMREVIKQALDVMREQNKLMLRVHRTQLTMTKKIIRSILTDYPSVSIMEVVADNSVKPQTCILDGPMGSVHSDLQTQIEHIKKTLLDMLG